MEQSNSEICSEDQAAIEAEDAILNQMEEQEEDIDSPTPGPSPIDKELNDLLATSGFRVIDNNMDITQIKIAQTKLVQDIGNLNIWYDKITEELSKADMIYATYEESESLRIAYEEANKPGHGSQKTGRALSNSEKEFKVNGAIRDLVQQNTPGYDIIADKRNLESLLNRMERVLKNIDRQAMIIASMAKTGHEQERFGNIHG